MKIVLCFMFVFFIVIHSTKCFKMDPSMTPKNDQPIIGVLGIHFPT